MSLELIRRFVDVRQPVLLWGTAGTGKSSAIAALAAEAGAHLETLIGSTVDPPDVGGYLSPRDSGLVSYPPPWAERLRGALDSGKRAWLFLDELSCAPPAMQAALLRVVLDSRVGHLSLGGMSVVAAANRSDVAADGGILSGAMANRFAHLDWTVSVNDWVVGELSGWGGQRSAEHSAASAQVCSFLQRHPSLLLAQPADSLALSGAWPTPRAWSSVARAMCGEVDHSLVAAALVGRAAATEFCGWLRAQDLPDPEAILSGKEKLPSRADRVSASLMALASAAVSDHPNRKGRVLRAWQIMSSVRADAAIIPARVLLAAYPTVPPEAQELGKKILEVRRAAPN